jgi:hypothetical protein
LATIGDACAFKPNTKSQPPAAKINIKVIAGWRRAKRLWNRESSEMKRALRSIRRTFPWLHWPERCVCGAKGRGLFEVGQIGRCWQCRAWSLCSGVVTP